jgi:hypothetical protein
MKNTYILLISVAVFTLHGFCSSPIPVNSTIHPTDIEQRGGLSLISLPLSWSGSKELVTRTGPDEFTTKTQLAMLAVKRTAIIGISAIGFVGLIGDCQELQSDPNVKNGFICVAGSVATAIAIATEGRKTAQIFMEVAKVSATATVNFAVNMALSQFIGGRMGLGPFARTPGQLPSKRDSHIFKRVEDHFTSKLGVEVRHIGFWDGTVQGDSQSEVVRREQFPEGVIPAFALKLYGQEVHFAYTGDDADGNSIFKIGNGPGPATEENKRRIKSRNSGDSIPLFNNYFFDQGGLDMVATSDIDNAGQGIMPDVSSNDFDYAWIYTQVLCLLGASDLQATQTQGTNYPLQFDAIGLWFQVYDDANFGTLAAGAIAPFSSNTQSVIQWLKPEGGLKVDETCSTT